MSATEDRLHFRTRGGPTQGWGNIHRLASFAERCRERGHGAPLFYAEGPPEVIAFLRAKGFEVVDLGDGVSMQEEREILRAHPRSKTTFVEMLDISPERQALLRGRTERLVVFDDLCDHVYDADLVVCGQGLPSHANQSLSSEGTEFLIGYDYFLMRPEFVAARVEGRKLQPCLRRVLVTLGGGSYDVGYLKAAKGLAAVEGELEVTFVIGREPSRPLRDALLEELPTARVLGRVADLPELLLQNDLVLSSAGYTKLEAALMGTPQLIMSVQWHQIPLAAVFSACSGVPDLGYMSYVVPQALAGRVQELQSVQAREETAHAAASVVDGQGFERVYHAVFEQGTQEGCFGVAA